MRTILLGKVVLPDALVEHGQITMENGRITYVGEQQDNTRNDDNQVFHWEKGYFWPGLIDIHVHGSGGADVMDGTEEALTTIAKTLLSYGVTGFLATTVTMNKEKLSLVLETAGNWERPSGSADILGVHLEGPWICPKYTGAQNPEYILEPVPGDGKWAYTTSNGKLKIVTLAPEQPNALEVIQELVQQEVIVSIGHTNATYDEVVTAVEHGASHITHTFNAMRGLHHREPGVVGAALSLDSLHCELIADGHHVHPKAASLLIHTKGAKKMLLVSDGIRAVNMAEGEFDLGGLKVTTKEGKATLDDGTLAGSLLTLNQAVMNAIHFAEIPIWDAVRMASLNQAIRLGLENQLGSLEVGKRAHVVAVDASGVVHQVWMDGTLEYRKQGGCT